MTNLVVDWCSYKAAKYAVEHWHYSERMPKSRQVYIGVWENKKFIGSVIIGMSITPYLGDSFGLDYTECAELTRIALTDHISQVSEIGAKAIKMVKEQSPELRLLVSYADPNVGHNGSIYQAMNWVYVGVSSSIKQYYYKGDWRNDAPMFREFQNNPKLREITKSRVLMPKHKYLYPLDRAMRRQIEPLAQLYPKSCGRSGEGNTPDDQSGDVGSTPAVRFDMTGGEPVLVENDYGN